VEAIKIHPSPISSPPTEEKIRQEATEMIETFPAPVLPSPILEKIRREQQALRENVAYREARAAADAKFRREEEAFRRLLPGLLQTHRDQYVAIHEGQVVGTGPDQIELADLVYERFGYLPILVTLVTDRPRVARVPSPRLIRVEDRA
jgi:hypothetical protein